MHKFVHNSTIAFIGFVSEWEKLSEVTGKLSDMGRSISHFSSLDHLEFKLKSLRKIRNRKTNQGNDNIVEPVLTATCPR